MPKCGFDGKKNILAFGRLTWKSITFFKTLYVKVTISILSYFKWQKNTFLNLNGFLDYDFFFNLWCRVVTYQLIIKTYFRRFVKTLSLHNYYRI